MFEPFNQVDRSRGRAQGGLGIGLTLVQRLVALHGGRVEARSEGPGTGSEFRVHLPLAAAAPHGSLAPRVPARAPLARRFARRRVLVVDDNEDGGQSLHMLLRLLGAESQVVHDGASALAALPSFRPSMVLLDLGMPGMDGYEVARRIRGLPGGDEPLVIAVTGWGQPADRRRTREAGFDHHLVKPVSLEVLQTVLAMADSSGWSRPGRPVD